MSDIADIKSTVSGIVDDVSGIGTIDTARVDPDDVPRKLRGTTPYWSLGATAISDAARGFGTTDRTFFRLYAVRLEGWRGIVAANQAAADWDALVEGILDALQEGIRTMAAGIDGFKGFRALGAPQVDIWSRGNTRAHHAVITFQVRVFKRLTPA